MENHWNVVESREVHQHRFQLNDVDETIGERRVS